jgi:hypothetical protein
MKKFLQLNKHKLKFAFKVSSLVFVSLVSIVFIIVSITSGIPDYSLIIIVILTAGIAFPCFTLFISYLAWYYKRWAKEKAFATPPFNELHVFGFTDKLQGEKTKWAFTEMVKGGAIHGFDMIADVLYNERNIIEVRAFTTWRQLDTMEYKRLSREFEEYNIEFDIGCFVKKYNIKRMSHLTINDLKRDLEEFTMLLKQNGFVPLMDEG